jgi:hypothetical protein
MSRKAIFLATLCSSLICVAQSALAVPVASPPITYACGFDSSGYTAPGTNTPVNVGGVFTMTIAGDAVTASDATLSVDNGGEGPAVCTYSSGTGSVVSSGQNSQNASITYQPANDNSSLCPADSASLTLTPTSSGLSFTYMNADGFEGHGTCGIADAPSSPNFTCKYTVNNDKGPAAGATTITLKPPLNEKAKLNAHLAVTFGLENYPKFICPTIGIFGSATYPLSAKKPNNGNWGVLIYSAPDCPTSPFSKVDFTTSATTIMITAPGLSNPTCTPGVLGTPSISVSPPSLNFGSQPVKTTSAPQTLTVKNNGTAPTEITGFIIKGPYDADNHCGTLGTGATCTIDVTFTPTAKASQPGNIQILTPREKIAVTLSGTGVK